MRIRDARAPGKKTEDRETRAGKMQTAAGAAERRKKRDEEAKTENWPIEAKRERAEDQINRSREEIDSGESRDHCEGSKGESAVMKLELEHLR